MSDSGAFLWREEAMNSKKFTGIVILIVGWVMGCAGNNANIWNLLDSESKAAQQELIDNWSNYEIRYNSVVLVFDPKNDNKKILVDSYWSTVEDQETWTQIVKGTKTLPNRRINQVWGNKVREIWVNWVNEDQFYGYVIHERRELISAEIVDQNTVRLIHNFSVDRRVWY